MKVLVRIVRENASQERRNKHRGLCRALMRTSVANLKLPEGTFAILPISMKLDMFLLLVCCDHHVSVSSQLRRWLLRRTCFDRGYETRNVTGFELFLQPARPRQRGAPTSHSRNEAVEVSTVTGSV
jgi:hypothetical protein